MFKFKDDEPRLFGLTVVVLEEDGQDLAAVQLVSVERHLRLRYNERHTCDPSTFPITTLIYAISPYNNRAPVTESS